MAPQTSALGEETREGRFVRQQSKFRDRPPTTEAGRYHLYVAPACPWSHRTMIVHRLNRLEDVKRDLGERELWERSYGLT